MKISNNKLNEDIVNKQISNLSYQNKQNEEVKEEETPALSRLLALEGEDLSLLRKSREEAIAKHLQSSQRAQLQTNNFNFPKDVTIKHVTETGRNITQIRDSMDGFYTFYYSRLRISYKLELSDGSTIDLKIQWEGKSSHYPKPPPQSLLDLLNSFHLKENDRLQITDALGWYGDLGEGANLALIRDGKLVGNYWGYVKNSP